MRQTYKQTMLKAMTKLAWKMFAIPRAKHKNMQSTPVLNDVLVILADLFCAMFATAKQDVATALLYPRNTDSWRLMRKTTAAA